MGLAGFGAVQEMVASIKRNKRQKKEVFGGRGAVLSKKDQAMGGLDKKASLQVLEEIRAKAKREKRRNAVVFASLFIVLGLVGYIFLN